MSLGFFFDCTRCVGCKSCQIACKDRFDLQKAGPRPRRVQSFETGSYPDAGIYHLSISCNHCESPACVAVCPHGALFKAEDGTVQYSDSLCTGCQFCVSACPYGAPQWIDELGIINKCDSCKALRDAGQSPVCVEACPMRALDFVEMESLQGVHGSALLQEIPSTPAAEVTSPNLLIKAKEIALQTAYREVRL